MFRPAASLATALLIALPGSLLGAWGAQGHALIAAAALKDLPPETALWFAGHEEDLPAHANDPDHWKGRDPQEGPRHFLECEAYGGPGQVPRDEAQAKAGLGEPLFHRSGQLPWTVLDRVERLSLAFKAFDRPQIALEAAYLCHYVADLAVPLHTTRNYDGEETGQRGVHHRWETGLVERLAATPGWTVSVRPVTQAEDAGDAPWPWLQQSYELVDPVLADDRFASREDQLDLAHYRSHTYWEVFLRRQGPVVEDRLAAAAQRTAQMILLAWKRAGYPAAPLPIR
jgi:hypothetical protein